MKKKFVLAAVIMAIAAAVPFPLEASDSATAFAVYGAGEVTTVKAGYKEQRTAGITVEWQAGSPSWSGDIAFALTDAGGNALRDVKFSRISVEAENFNFTGRDCYNDENHCTEKGALADEDGVYFNENGNEAVLAGVAVSNDKKGKLEIAFEISPDINFEGDVYIAVSASNVTFTDDGGNENGGILKVAEVKPTVAVETKTTEIQIGAQRIPVADITIKELDEEHPLEKGKKIELALGQYGVGYPVDIKFVPVENGNVAVIEGGMKIKTDKANEDSDTITITVDKAGVDGLSAIRLSGLQVKVDRSVSYGTYELYVSGSALRDNGMAEFVADGIISDTGADRKDCFDNPGIMIDDYIVIDTYGPCGSYHVVTVFNDGTPNVVVNGVTGEMGAPTVNIDGSLYVPLRFIAYALGATESDIVWDDAARTVSVRLSGQVVTWTQDSPVYVTGGVETAMNNDATACIINDRLYIPFRGFAEAFFIPVAWDEDTQSATYNP